MWKAGREGGRERGREEREGREKGREGRAGRQTALFFRDQGNRERRILSINNLSRSLKRSLELYCQLPCKVFKGKVTTAEHLKISKKNPTSQNKQQNN